MLDLRNTRFSQEGSIKTSLAEIKKLKYFKVFVKLKYFVVVKEVVMLTNFEYFYIEMNTIINIFELYISNRIDINTYKTMFLTTESVLLNVTKASKYNKT